MATFHNRRNLREKMVGAVQKALEKMFEKCRAIEPL
jgi:hypothetical protein